MATALRATQTFESFRCVVCDSQMQPSLVCDKVKDDGAGLMAAVQCSNCSQIQLSPPAYDLDFYKDDGQIKSVVSNYGTQMETLFNHSFIEARRRTERFSEMGLKPDALEAGSTLRVLDVGGGYGFFGSEFKRHYPNASVTVLEPSAERLQIGADHLSSVGRDDHLPQMHAGLLDEQFATEHAGEFDIVSMWHVLEHVPRPAELIALAARILAPGGILCIEVPNINDELLARSTNFRLRSFMREHISYFSPETLIAAARRALPDSAINVCGYQRYGIFNYMHWISANAPQGANPDLHEGTDRWWLETTWRATREQMLTSDALYMTIRL